MEQTDEESDEGFERMNVDENKGDDSSQMDQDTDQATDEDTDNEVRLSPQPPETEPATDDEVDRPAQAAESKAASQQARTTPPRRELPFTRRDQSRAKPREVAEETAGGSDDDEL